MNAKAQREEDDAWEDDVEGLIERLKDLTLDQILEIDSKDIHRWATHPDERVRIALVQSGLMQDPFSHRKIIVEKILERNKVEAWPGER